MVKDVSVGNIDFVYTLKKALNLYVFTNPLVISDFIDILDNELRQSIETDALKSVEFKDGDYEFTIIVDKDAINGDAHTILNTIIDNTIMQFCNSYEEQIKNALYDMKEKKVLTAFSDCIKIQDRYKLGWLIQRHEFTSNSNDYCIILELS